MFDATSNSYYELGGNWATTQDDDGWWLDNIQVTGAITGQRSLLPDTGPLPPGSCPASTDNCNENLAATDKGTTPVLKVTDLNGNVIRNDGVGLAYAPAGTPIRVTAADSSVSGGCFNGAAQFRFTKNGALVQDWSAKTFYQDTMAAGASYSVLVRCSSDFSCTSLVGATTLSNPYVDDIDLSVANRVCSTNQLTVCNSDFFCVGGTTPNAACVPPTTSCGTGVCTATCTASGVCVTSTVLSWPSTPQASPLSGYNVFRGTQPDDGNSGTANLPATVLDPGAPTNFGSLVCNVPNAGPTVSTTTALQPAANTSLFFLVGHRNPGASTVLGLRSNGTARIAPISCP